MLDHEQSALVQGLLAGDEEAFDAFFSEYFPRLYRFASRLLKSDRATAEDVVQTTLINALRGMSSFRGEAPLFTWLCTICRREIHKVRMRDNRMDVVDGSVEDSLDMLVAFASEESPLTQLERSEIRQRVHATLDLLPLRYARALEWKYLMDFTVAEIAVRLSTSEKAAESVLTRARQSFRDAFGLQSNSDGTTYEAMP